MKKERNTNIELLRLGLMLGIFVYHLLVHGLDFKTKAWVTFHL